MLLAARVVLSWRMHVRPIRRVLITVGFLAATFSPVWAQEWVPLEKKEVKERRSLLGGGSQWLGKTSGKPARLKGLPEEMGTKLSYFSARIGGQQTWLVIGSPPAGSKPRTSPRFIADTDQDGDLSDEKIVAGRKKREGGWLFGRTVDHYGPLTFKPADDADSADVELTFQYYGADGLAASPAFERAGDVTVDGQEYHLILSDGNADGRFDGFYGPSKKQSQEEETDSKWTVFSEFDAISITLKDARPAAEDAVIYRFWDTPPLTKTLRLKDVYYHLEVKPDGSAIRLAKTDLPVGTLDVGCADAYLTLFSECGLQELQGSGGKWRLPAGRYVCWSLGLRLTDEAGVVWTLQGSGDTGKLGEIVIEPDKTVALKMGPPLKVKTEARQISGLFGRNRYVSMGLTGQAGESYSHGAYKNRWRLPPPKLKILDESGQVMANGQFEYG